MNFGRAGKYADCSRSHDETAPANRSNTTGQAQLQPSSPPCNPRGLTRQGLEPVRAAAGPNNHRGRLGSCSMLAFELQEFQMEMEKVMAKLKILGRSASERSPGERICGSQSGASAGHEVGSGQDPKVTRLRGTIVRLEWFDSSRTRHHRKQTFVERVHFLFQKYW